METVKRQQFNFKCRIATSTLLKALADDLDVPIWALAEYMLSQMVAAMLLKVREDDKVWQDSLRQRLYENHIWVKEERVA
jgi:hypothetical protein